MLCASSPPLPGKNKHRFVCFNKLVGQAKNAVILAKLPPTSSAARHHFRRVFHQVQSWRSNVLPPEEWGWKKTVNCLLPILNTEPPAPASILKLITCACKEGCGRRCGCVKADLRCTTMCKNCRGQSCVNVVELINNADF